MVAMFTMLMVLMSAVAAWALPVSYTFSGEVSALYPDSYFTGGTPYQRSADQGFILDPPVVIHEGGSPDGQQYVFSNILIGPSFSGTLTYDPDILHDLQWSINFSSGNWASSGSGFSTSYQNGEFSGTGTGYFDNGQSLESKLLCDPVVYFNGNEMTGLGSVRFEFTDVWSGVLTCEIEQFKETHTAPIPEPSTFFLLACGGTALLFMRQRFVAAD